MKNDANARLIKIIPQVLHNVVIVNVWIIDHLVFNYSQLFGGGPIDPNFDI